MCRGSRLLEAAVNLVAYGVVGEVGRRTAVRLDGLLVDEFPVVLRVERAERNHLLEFVAREVDEVIHSVDVYTAAVSLDGVVAHFKFDGVAVVCRHAVQSVWWRFHVLPFMTEHDAAVNRRIGLRRHGCGQRECSESCVE